MTTSKTTGRTPASCETFSAAADAAIRLRFRLDATCRRASRRVTVRASGIVGIRAIIGLALLSGLGAVVAYLLR